MRNITKISALISLFIVVIMFMGAVFAANSEPVDDVMSNYGAPPQDDGSGIPYFVDDDGYVVPTHFLTNAQYKEMWKKIAKWQVTHHTIKLPNYVDISYMKVGVNKVTKSQFLDMKKRWDAWKKTHNGKEPNIIGVEQPIGTISW